ncbi:hypothetical protein DTO207G8_5093 [Paecilomyces variotii]|nr:hypothetical protein DTO169E5_2048 [Paecilomyces variotii]KAJ9251878.1 hypothetical protein DTO207G8_5093 [Paecilomyces variotii]
MERLQELVDAVHESRTGLTTNLIINLLVGSQSVQALRSWTARGRKKSDDDDDSTPDTPQTPRKRRIGQISSEEVTSSEVVTPSKHSKAVKKLCLEKDQESCILTEAGEPIEVCHILPFAIKSRLHEENENHSTPISTCNIGPRPNACKLFDGLSETKLCSGDTFTLTTDDPQSKPLPSIELLQMQWTLQRLIAISGAAGVNDEELFDSDDGYDDDDE